MSSYEDLLNWKREKLVAAQTADSHKGISPEAEQISKYLWNEYEEIRNAIKGGASSIEEVQLALQKSINVSALEESLSQVVFLCDYTLSQKESIVIPEGTTEISKGAFRGSDVKEVILPSTLVKIGEKAFEGCEKLSLIDFSRCKNLEEIGESAFWDCNSLKQVNLPDSIRKMSKYTFRSLENIVFPASLEELDDSAFDNYCNNLRVADFSKCIKLERIGASAFSNLENLETVILPPNIKVIEDEAFCYCSNLKSIDFKRCPKLEHIGYRAFDNIPITSVDLSGTNVKFIGAYAFNNNHQLSRINLPDSLMAIGEEAFACTGLTEIVIPDTVEHIGKKAFADNEKLERATIGLSAKDYSYENNYSGGPIFKNTPNLKEITFKSAVAEYTGATTLTKVFFSDTVKELGKWAVAECADIEEVIISDSVTKIGYGAFAACERLQSIKLSDNITEIGESAFAKTRLREIVFPRELQKLEPLGEELTKLRKLDFSKVTKLKVLPEDFIGDDTPKLREIVIPIGVERIEEGIGGENLEKIYLPPTIKEVEDLHQINLDIYCYAPKIEELGMMIESIEDAEDACTLYVLPEYVESYKAQRAAEDISEDLLIIDVIPEEFRYYYDN